jgi:hypothetical protein
MILVNGRRTFDEARDASLESIVVASLGFESREF